MLSLALNAANIPHEIRRAGFNWLIKVDEKNALLAHSELVSYEQENQLEISKQVDIAPPVTPVAPPLTILFMGGLVILYSLSGPWSDHGTWFTYGAVSGKRILQHGEWWRVITGLTLHADIVHIFGNLLIGGILVHFLILSVGNGIGLFLLMLTGALGNSINIIMHGSLHNSVGFSTAIFGAIGLMTGMQCVRKGQIAFKNLILPLVAGVALLAMLGSSGQNTDLGAHFWGMAVGLACGALLELVPQSEEIIRNRTTQSIFLMGSIMLTLFAWLLAWP